MTRSHGRCAKGERLRMGFPHGHRKTTTLVAGLRMTGMVAPMVLDGPINGDWFEAYVAQVLVPELRPGDIVIMDNLSSHKRARCARRSRRQAQPCASSRPTAPTSIPIEKAFSRLKAHAAKSRRAHRLRPLGPHRQAPRHLPARTNAPTTSAHAGTNRNEWKPL